MAAFQRLLEDRVPGELHAFAALTHMLSDKLPVHYSRQLVAADTETVLALVAALGSTVSSYSPFACSDSCLVCLYFHRSRYF